LAGNAATNIPCGIADTPTGVHLFVVCCSLYQNLAFMNNVASGFRHSRADDGNNGLSERQPQRSSTRSGDENPCWPTLYAATGSVSQRFL
jgi:hypothetical protein